MGEFKASKYQKAIFREIEEGTSNIVIEAAAGSGKTTTIMKAIEKVPSDKSVLVIAFNRDIVAELKNRLKGKRDATVMTLHGLGLSIVRGYMRGINPNINEYKYRTYLHDNLKYLTKHNLYGGGKSDFYRMLNCVMRIIDLGRCCLCDTRKDMDEMCKRYGILTKKDEVDVAMASIEWGKNNNGTIDYGDMVWLPHALDMRNSRMKYDYVFIDECQDLNMAQMELFKSCIKEGGRFIAVGDKNQGIYAFSGADSKSFDKIKSSENTISLPLSITYRCAKEIVEIARKIVPTIEANPDNDTVGIVDDGTTEMDITDNAMVLCRNNAPLIELYIKLLSSGRKCFVRGREIGTNMISLLYTTSSGELNSDLSGTGVFSELFMDLLNDKDMIAKMNKLSDEEAIMDSAIQSKYDMIQSLKTLSVGCRTKNELIEKIKGVFTDTDEDGIALSTVHKAKGLEADDVFILEHSLMPSTSATREWEIEQEDHLLYVAYTRAKKRLSFMKENNKSGVSRQQKMASDFAMVEMKLKRLYGRDTNKTMTDSGYSSVIVENSEKLSTKKPSKSIVIGERRNNAASRFAARTTKKINLKKI